MIALFAVTHAGRAAATEVARALGPDAVVVDGPLSSQLERLWPKLGAAVFFLATGATVRLIAPLLADKYGDPGIVCVDEARRHAIALAGGHAGGANSLAHRVAEVLGAEPVVSTASDAVGQTPLDELIELLGAQVEGDLAGCARAVLDGEPVLLIDPLGHPLPPLPSNVSASQEQPQWTIRIDDRLRAVGRRELRVIPPSLTIGLGSARGVARTAVDEVIAGVLEAGGLDPRAVGAFASLDLKADEEGMLAATAAHAFLHGADRMLDLQTFPADELAGIDVPNPSEVVRAEVGTPSVAEAAALRAAALRSGSPEFVALAGEKITGDNATAACARARPRGRLAIVGLGPGQAGLRTPAADAELRRAAVVVGLDQYLDQIRGLLRPGTRECASGLGQEEQRAEQAVRLAAQGHAVALVGSGDAGVYAMASPALQQAGEDIEVVTVPGVTAALSASALLGAPLGHDHVLISLSDLHTPWEAIESRVRAAATADLVVVFYNPRSQQRDWQLPAAMELLSRHRGPDTPVGAVRQAGRAEQHAWCAPLRQFDPGEVDMLTTVIVGCTTTEMVAGRMVTPRGYRWMPAPA